MPRTIPAFLLGLLLIAPLPAQQSPLVSADWLMEHISDPDLVVLHVASARRDYASGHIPGARFVWWGGIAPSTPESATELPSLEEAQALLREASVRTDSRIVVAFGGRSITSGTRTLYTLQYFGLAERTFLLDGGTEAWKAAGGEVSTDVPTVVEGDVVLSTHPEVFADAEFVKDHLDDTGVTIVDARTDVYYNGRPAGQPRSGHIRGAVNVQYSAIVDSLNRFRSVDELQKAFEGAGVRTGSTVVTYCHIGQQASVALLAARLLGHAVKLYDGSFEEWGYLGEEYPVEKTEEQ